MKLLRLACFIVFAMLPCLLSARAQFDRGVVVGSVRDTSGASVAGVTLTLLKESTKTKVSTATNKAGDYVFNDQPTGDYTIAAQAGTFKDVPPVRFTLDVGSHQRVDLTLVPRSVQQEVNVSAAPSQLKPTAATGAR